MEALKYRVKPVVHWLHSNLLLLIILANGLAVAFPWLGQQIRLVSVGTIPWVDHESVRVTLPMLMLAFLLFNAGLGIRVPELKLLWQKPLPLVFGLLANFCLPVLFICLFFLVFHSWHDANELGNLMTGLALVAAMPIAGSSTAWSQNIDGDLALSLGLVMISTLLSPWTTPLTLTAIAGMTTGDFREDLQEMAVHGTSAFLLVTVMLPSLLGMMTHWVIGARRTRMVQPYLKLLNLFNLLLLGYSNASASLPQAFSHFDPDFLLLTAVVSIVLCAAAFCAGGLIARLLKTPRAEQVSLMFGLGMNNNGTGLVLSATALSDHPLVMLPIIFYNLAQQVIAGIVDRRLSREQL